MASVILKEIQDRFQLQQEYLGLDKPVNRIDPLVSVTLVTYNHVKHLVESIESILRQRTTFPFEIVIGEDGSNDGTRELCIEYAEKYPDKIRLFLRDRGNSILKIDGKNKILNGHFTRWATRGKYVAIIEGDDYWKSPDKLQVQADFLERNPDYSACFTNVEIQDDLSNRAKQLHYLDAKSPLTSFEPAGSIPEIATTADLIMQRRIMIVSWMVNRQIMMEFPEWFYEIPFGDRSMAVLMAEAGRVRYIPEIMSVYRLHEGGIWTGATSVAEKYETSIKIFKLINEHTRGKYDLQVRARIAQLLLVIASDFEKRGDMTNARAYLMKAKETLPEMIK